MRKNILIRSVGVLALLSLVGAGTSRAEEKDNCLCRDIDVRCQVRPSNDVLVGEPFEVCAVVHNEGTHVLENICVRMQLCSGLVVLGTEGTTTQIPSLPVGATHTHCIRVMATMVGPCRITAHAQDDTAIAAAGCYCDARVAGLPALQLQMVDLDANEAPQGVFRIGEEVLYRLLVEEDEGSTTITGLLVGWELPPELEFVRGEAPAGTTITGSGQQAETSVFNLAPGDVKEILVIARVLSVPRRNLVQTHARILTATGRQELATESESTTLRN